MKLTPRASSYARMFGLRPPLAPDRHSEVPVFRGETYPRHHGILVPRVSRIPSLAHHQTELRARQAARRHPRSRMRQRGFIVNPYAYSSTPTDPNFASVVLLLHFNDSGDYDKDSSSYNDTTGATIAGSPGFDGTTKKWGAGAYGGNGAILGFNDAARFTLGSSDWTVEFWVNFSSVTGFRWLSGHSASSGANTTVAYGIGKTASAGSKPYILCCSGSTAYEVTGGTTVTTGTWYHFAAARNGNNLRMFMDGAQEGSNTSVTGVSFNDPPNKLGVGGLGEYTTNAHNGYIDDFRFTVGVARYTGSYTTPTAQFPDA